jgi:hypothetical protein
VDLHKLINPQERFGALIDCSPYLLRPLMRKWMYDRWQPFEPDGNGYTPKGLSYIDSAPRGIYTQT